MLYILFGIFICLGPTKVFQSIITLYLTVCLADVSHFSKWPPLKSITLNILIYHPCWNMILVSNSMFFLSKNRIKLFLNMYDPSLLVKIEIYIMTPVIVSYIRCSYTFFLLIIDIYFFLIFPILKNVLSFCVILYVGAPSLLTHPLCCTSFPSYLI